MVSGIEGLIVEIVDGAGLGVAYAVGGDACAANPVEVWVVLIVDIAFGAGYAVVGGLDALELAFGAVDIAFVAVVRAVDLGDVAVAPFIVDFALRGVFTDGAAFFVATQIVVGVDGRCRG